MTHRRQKRRMRQLRRRRVWGLYAPAVRLWLTEGYSERRIQRFTYAEACAHFPAIFRKGWEVRQCAS